MKKTMVMSLVLAIFAVGGAPAQANTNHPGYYPIEEMGVFAKGDLEVDIDLQGAMLQVAAAAMQGENGNDADLAQLVSGLERVRVQVGEPQRADASTIASSFERAIATMEGAGWNRILKAADDEELIYMYALESAGRIVGLTALINDDNEEIILVNIVGDIDPVALGKVVASSNRLADLDVLMDVGQ